jgi:hypothetical protein
MPSPAEVISLLVAVEFVVMSAIVLRFVPLKAAAPIIPLLLVFLITLQLYRG